MVDLEPLEVGRRVADLLKTQRYTELLDLVEPTLRERFSVATLEELWDDVIANVGTVSDIGEPIAYSAGTDRTIVVVAISYDLGIVTVILLIEAGWITRLSFKVADFAELWQPPEYANPSEFTERNIKLESGGLAVPGTLSLPANCGSVPAVVLVAGSGPSDRDSTMGCNKPLKDIAWGLASRQIAVLRFDKVTLFHPDRVAANPDFTVVDEYLGHTVAAIQFLLGEPTVDAERIYILGHSQGGAVLPRIAVAEPKVAGLVILAGATQQPHQSILRQIRYLASSRGTTDLESDPSVQEAVRQTSLLESPEFSRSTPSSLLPFGTPAPYWLDLLSYDPVSTAAHLDKRMLILQGGRDYQVTVEDDLVNWRNGLQHRSDVTVRVYDDDNHLFLRGSGPSVPAEYQSAQHVDADVITDIANWILR